MKSIKEIRRENLQKCVDEIGEPKDFLNLYAHLYGKDGKLSHSYLLQLLSGSSAIGDATAQKLEVAMGKQRYWLDTDRSGQISNFERTPIGGRRIPLIDYVQAGHMAEVADPYVVGDAEEWLQTDLTLSSNSFALKIRGNSMLPEFKEGDVVLIDPSVEPLPGDFVVAKNSSEEATFKKYRPRGVGQNGELIFELIPLNEDYPSFKSDTTPIRIIGTMIEHRKYRRR